MVAEVPDAAEDTGFAEGVESMEDSEGFRAGDVQRGGDSGDRSSLGRGVASLSGGNKRESVSILSGERGLDRGDFAAFDSGCRLSRAFLNDPFLFLAFFGCNAPRDVSAATESVGETAPSRVLCLSCFSMGSSELLRKASRDRMLPDRLRL